MSLLCFVEFVRPVRRNLKFYVKNEMGALVKVLNIFGVSKDVLDRYNPPKLRHVQPRLAELQ